MKAPALAIGDLSTDVASSVLVLDRDWRSANESARWLAAEARRPAPGPVGGTVPLSTAVMVTGFEVNDLWCSDGSGTRMAADDEDFDDEGFDEDDLDEDEDEDDDVDFDDDDLDDDDDDLDDLDDEDDFDDEDDEDDEDDDEDDEDYEFEEDLGYGEEDDPDA